MTDVADNTSATDGLLAEYRYDADNHRIAWRHTTAAGGDDLWYYPVYDAKWRMIEVRRDESGTGGSAQARLERFYYHNAGLAGSGNSSYVDSVIRRDRNVVTATPETLEEAVYYLQNWRGDVISLVNSDGSTVEDVRYTAYGRPMVISGSSLTADFDNNGVVDVSDIFAFLRAWFAHCTGPGTPSGCLRSADWNSSGGTPDVSDIFAFLHDWFGGGTTAVGTVGQLTLSTTGNRKGYAGYEHDDLWPDMELARERWYRADLSV